MLIGKSHAQALIIRDAIGNGHRVYRCSGDPNKAGEVVDVNLPKEIQSQRKVMKREILTLGNMPKSKTSNVFLVKDMSSIKALQYWLRDKSYNQFTDHKDKNGNTIFGLAYNEIWCEEIHRKGIIVLVNESLKNITALNITKGIFVSNNLTKSVKMESVDHFKELIEKEDKKCFDNIKRL